MSGRLNFSFTTSRDSTFIQFKDLIGRRTLFLVMKGDSMEAWDMLHNRRYKDAAILISLPFLEMAPPEELRSILWGEFPKSENFAGDHSSLNGRIQIKSDITELGPLVNQVSFFIDEENQRVDLTISNREFGEQYPHLIKPIPATIPSIEMDSL